MDSHPLENLSIREIINKPPGFGEVFAELVGLGPDVDDRSYAIIEGSKLQSALELYLRNSLSHMSSKAKEQFFDKPDAICSTFSEYIYVAYAVKIIGKTTLSEMDVIRNIRNAFAHAKVHVDFTAPAIVDSCRTLRTWSDDPGAVLPTLPGASVLQPKSHPLARRAYGAACDALKRSMLARVYPGGLASFGVASSGLPLD